MDCEKFDLLVMDALYDELDELTLAAARRHTESCTRCQAAWSGLKATKKVGLLQLVEPPAGLSERVLLLAQEAQRNVPWPRRMGRAVSWAASYAMRPQMAMAALLLLMVGSSLLLLRAKPNRSAPAQVSVTERGVPEGAGEVAITGDRPLAPAPSEARLEPSSGPAGVEAAPGAIAAAEAPPPDLLPEPKAEAARRVAAPNAMPGADEKSGAGLDFGSRPVASKKRSAAAGGTGAASGKLAARDEVPLAAPTVAAASGAAASDTEGRGTAAGGSETADLFASAMALYRAGRYAEAVGPFDRAAAAGGANAALASLYAARSAQASSGCPTAVGRFETTAARFAGTGVAADALWAAATCHRSLGDAAQARADYTAVRNFPAYRERADQALVALGGAPSPPAKGEPQRAAAKPAAPASPAPAAASPEGTSR